VSAPEVSVVTTVYDGERYLPEALASILRQTFENFEWIIVDDGSTDGTPDLLHAIPDPRVRLFRQRNAGVAAGLNRALAEVRAPLVARMDADDVSHPERLARQVDFLRARPALAACGTAFRQIDEGGRVQGIFAVVPVSEILGDLLLAENPFQHGSMMVRAAVYRRFGGYRPTASEDYELWTRVIRAHSMGNINEVLYDWRWHPKAVTKRTVPRMVASALETRARFVHGAPDPVDAARVDALTNPRTSMAAMAAARAAWSYTKAAEVLLRAGECRKARACLRSARACAGRLPAGDAYRLFARHYRMSARRTAALRTAAALRSATLAHLFFGSVKMRW